MFIYDIEIKKAVPPKNNQLRHDVEYCKGWKDTANMGVACIAVYSYWDDRYRIFADDNMAEFMALCKSGKGPAVGFNNIAFDNAVLRDDGIIDIPAEQSYDLLRQIWLAAGLGPFFEYPTHAGYGLDAVCHKNFGTGKTGYGGDAPIDYQKCRFGTLHDYCLTDVALTKKLLDKVLRDGTIVCPKTSAILEVERPT